MLEEHRKKIDAIDSRIMELVGKRMEVAREIAEYKKERNISVYQPQREAEIIERYTERAKKGGWSTKLAGELARDIIGIAREAQNSEKVGILGPRGTFTEEAARKYFGNREFVVLPSIPAVFDAVESGAAEYGVVPCENMLEGSVNLTLDLLVKSSAKIWGEVTIPVQHSLIANPGTLLSDIKRISSIPIALAQCRHYIETNFPGISLGETASTAQAVERLADGEAAVGTALAAKLYGKEILAEGIQDEKSNFTRFFVLSRNEHGPTGKDKTSLVFTLPHKPGTLYGALKVFADNGVNLTKIESRPARGGSWDYLFFVDFEGHASERQDALEALRKHVVLLKVLGSYPAG